MRCDNCKKDIQWLDMIGVDFVCKKCINKNKLIGLVHRTHINTFKEILKKLKIKNYEELMSLTRPDIEAVVNLRKKGIYLKTSNIVYLD